MESASKQASTPARSWNNRVERRHLPKVDYYAELNTWVQRAILEAEKNKDFNKKNQFLILLEDL
jgi:phosphatidylinositol kinase/protein kinase (PI-3  family)